MLRDRATASFSSFTSVLFSSCGSCLALRFDCSGSCRELARLPVEIRGKAIIRRPCGYPELEAVGATAREIEGRRARGRGRKGPSFDCGGLDAAAGADDGV